LRPPILHRDTRAAIDVPFKLLLSVVLIAMATAILFPALQAYQQSEMENRIAITVAEIEAVALSVHRHPGSSRTVLVDIPPSGGIRLERLTLGGDLASAIALVGTISWDLSNGVSGRVLVSTSSGPLPMAGTDGVALVVDGFPCLLVMKCDPSPPGAVYPTFVRVSVL
jgi:hypothetical protein